MTDASPAPSNEEEPLREEPQAEAQPPAPAPARARRRFKGPRDMRRLLGEAGLPQRLRATVLDVVQRTGLWRTEKRD